MNVKKINVEEVSRNSSYNYQSSSWTYTYSSRQITEKLGYPIDEWTPISKKLRSIKIGKGKLEDGQNVYLDKCVVFPRKKFKTSYPNNKLVYDISQADVIVTEQNSLYDFSRTYEDTYYLLQNGNYGTYDDQPGVVKPLEKLSIFSCSDDFHKKVIEYNKITDKHIIINSKELDFTTDNLLNEEAFEKICLMFKSSEDSMKNLAMTLLAAYDYRREYNKIAMLLCLNYSNWLACKDKKYNVEIKTMLKKVSDQYGSFHKMHPDNCNAFWFRIIREHPEDLMMFKNIANFGKKEDDE